ncbi:MarR family winged helix-turn-helix transcriptional regulator [Membranihabitans maritimus]|uniref:MarR family winged helix-turn-helix transcriptional regulator n=1 Tax=Membranihabitans maritimus TaxID=2904244 RepID=UPI001EFFEF04|nr:MarR family transcriptional regulator [Membranihabitans maritimus]
MGIAKDIKQPEFKTSREKALTNLLYTFHWYHNRENKIFKCKDLTAQQFNVLRILRGAYPDYLNMGKIKEVMLDKNPDVTRLSNRLEKKNMVEKKQNSENRREILIRINQKGLDTLKSIDPLISQLINEIGVSEEEAEKLSCLLDKMRE